MARVFISYARRPSDVAPVEAIRASAENFGVEVWLDSRSLVAGDEFRTEIERAIAASDLLILAVSAESLTSGYVALETRLAQALGKAILPLLLDDIPFERAPEHLRTLHAEPLFRRPRADWPSVLWEAFSKRGIPLTGPPPGPAAPLVPYARAFRPGYREFRGEQGAVRAHIEEALRALKYENASPWTVLNLALLYLLIGDHRNAAASASRAVATLPESGEAHYVAALVMASQETITTLPLPIVHQILFRLDTARAHGFDDAIVDLLTIIVGHERFQRHSLVVPQQVGPAIERLRANSNVNWDEYLRMRDVLKRLDPALCANLPEPQLSR
ncbi:MAG TPA: toll/interleukin-1 receptor domain-containing protein [Terricaulis sp.]|nr:toll/interleukin-1 receptor domain-containing protein [Terricaulis sp.]